MKRLPYKTYSRITKRRPGRYYYGDVITEVVSRRTRGKKNNFISRARRPTRVPAPRAPAPPVPRLWRPLAVVGVHERTVLDGVRVVARAVAVFAPERPEPGTSGTHRVPHQVAAVHLGRLLVLVAERAVVFHQLVDGVAVGVDAVEQTGRPAAHRRTGGGVGSVRRRRAVVVVVVHVRRRHGPAAAGRRSRRARLRSLLLLRRSAPVLLRLRPRRPVKRTRRLSRRTARIAGR